MAGSGIIRVKLKDLRFYSSIGLYDQERKVGNEFRLNIILSYDASGFRHEDLNSGISYVEIYDIVKDEMRKEWLLLESVAQSISKCIVARWSIVEELEIEIEKINTPISGITGSCAIEYLWKKSL